MLCDRAVAFGKDITSAQDMFDINFSNKSKVNMFIINLEDVLKMDKTLIKDVPPAPNTMKTLQLIWKKSDTDTLFLNHLSCTICLKTPPCLHYGLKPNKYSMKKIRNK